jgi:hypothetical protein
MDEAKFQGVLACPLVDRLIIWKWDQRIKDQAWTFKKP